MTCPFQSAPNELAKENDSALDYDNYLQLDKILNANSPKSGKNAAKWAHTEHLFITIHQVNSTHFVENPFGQFFSINLNLRVCKGF